MQWIALGVLMAAGVTLLAITGDPKPKVRYPKTVTALVVIALASFALWVSELEKERPAPSQPNTTQNVQAQDALEQPR